MRVIFKRARNHRTYQSAVGVLGLFLMSFAFIANAFANESTPEPSRKDAREWFLEPAVLIETSPWSVPSAETHQTATQTIESILPKAGRGAPALRRPADPDGIPLDNFEAELSLRARRANTGAASSTGNHLALRVDKEVAGEIAQAIGKLKLRAGWAHDPFGKTYLDRGNTPFRREDDRQRTLWPDHRHGFLEAHWSERLWQSRTVFDYRSEYPFAGKERLGKKFEREVFQRLHFPRAWSQPSAYASFGAQQFLAEYRPDWTGIHSVPSSETRNWSGGLVGEVSGIVHYRLGREVLSRDYSHSAILDFSRDQLELMGVYGWQNRRVKTRFFLGGEVARDSFMSRNPEGPAFLPSRSENRWRAQWEGGGEVAYSPWNQFVLEGKLVRYKRTPKPSELYGNGAHVQPNPDLQAESGWRGEAAVRVGDETLFIRPRYFGGWSENLALPMGISHQFAQFRNLGMNLTHGVGFESGWTWDPGDELRTGYEWQMAINESEMSWQKGRPMPGRPEHRVWVDSLHQWRQWNFGAHYSYEAGEFLDLAGQVRLPSAHQFDMSLSHEFKRARLTAKVEDLFTGASSAREPLFAGAAGASVLEPKFRGRSFGMELEMNL